MEFWNDELPERQQKLAHEDGRTDEGNFYIEREIVLLNIYTYVKVPEESAPHSIMIISGTLHVEEFECRGARAPMPFCAACSRATLSLATDERDVDAWIESIERARSWAVDQEEMRTFAGADGEDIDYEEFMEFQRKKAKEKAKQLSDLNKTQDRREREDDMAGTQHEEGIVRCPLPPPPAAAIHFANRAHASLLLQSHDDLRAQRETIDMNQSVDSIADASKDYEEYSAMKEEERSQDRRKASKATSKWTGKKKAPPKPQQKALADVKKKKKKKG